MHPVEFVKYLRDLSLTNVNYYFGREFLPDQRKRLSVETSSICNLACRFCAYPKKESPKVIMPLAFFCDCIDQAVAMGFETFPLTPCTGDVFMDKGIWEKLEFLDAHPGVQSYDFYTNFILLDPEKIDRLLALEKLRYMAVSVYGHDLDSFRKITLSEENSYRRLMTNLEHLLVRLPDVRFSLKLGLRTYRHFRKGESDLLRLLESLRRAGVDRFQINGAYNNWGGLITDADVAGLDMRIHGAESVYKKGPCARLFTDIQVMASGIVNGCACRDANATLQLGDLKERPLREIISPYNERYRELIEEQQRGDFRDICKSCDWYKSIYKSRPGRTLTTSEYFRAL